ncbi:hypothetical protein K523DRAFT_155634 [Schizophyllum commune Tattone D]|nr:hypothetical protein K523DRAFT_155634 [Schizophyllum commune Tattone D]
MPCCDAAPRSSSDAVAVVPRLHPVRDAQACEGGCVLGATARSSAGEETGPSLATPKELGRIPPAFSNRRRHARAPLDEITDVVEVHDPSQTRHEGVSSYFPPSPMSKHAAFSCELEPPEAHVRTLERWKRRWRAPSPSHPLRAGG